jgi:hypothetical protein
LEDQVTCKRKGKERKGRKRSAVGIGQHCIALARALPAQAVGTSAYSCLNYF